MSELARPPPHPASRRREARKIRGTWVDSLLAPIRDRTQLNPRVCTLRTNDRQPLRAIEEERDREKERERERGREEQDE